MKKNPPTKKMKKVKKVKKIALIDADILLYQSACTVEQEIDWGGDWWTLHSDVREAKMVFDVAITDIKEATAANDFILCFSSPNNWRFRVLADYKANRAGTRKPLCYTALRKYAEDTYDHRAYPLLEADDVVGLIATSPCDDHDYIMVSQDKDFKSIPGNHYNPRKQEFFTVSQTDGDRFHLFQTLVGDTTDNYKGCPGFGPVKAESILNNSASWESVVECYKKSGLTEEDALVQARVARILRHGEYNKMLCEVKLWTP
jgi:DNA polymerase-1